MSESAVQERVREAAAVLAPRREAPPGTGLRRVARYSATPLLVAAGLGALYLYVQGQELDVLEQGRLNSGFIRTSVVQHLRLSLWATAIVLAVAIPLGIALTRPWARRVTPFAVAAANIGQGVPSIGTLVVVYLVVLEDNGARAAIVGLAIYALLPVLRGTMVGLQQVDPDVIKAARGMGMSRGEILRRIELPLSVPILATGVRTALVLIISTAPLAAFIGGGGLGEIILTGFGFSRPLIIITGSVLAAAMALLADWLGGIAEATLRPRGL